MSRYIDADKLISALKIFNDEKNGNKHFLNGIRTAIEIVENNSFSYCEPHLYEMLKEGLKPSDFMTDKDKQFQEMMDKIINMKVKRMGDNENDKSTV